MRRGVGIVLAAVVAVGLAVLLPASPAAACSCVEALPADEQAAMDEYEVVFTGEVTRNEGVDIMRRELGVTVDRVFKGEAETEQLVVSHAQTSACGADPAVGSQVLFLMTRGSLSPADDFAEPDELVVGSCGGHRPATDAVALGEGRPPDDAPAAAPDAAPAAAPDEEALAPWVVGAVVLVVGLGGVVLARTRARARSGPGS